MSTPVRGAVFDFDGVLADSMHQHAEAYRRVLKPHGVEVQDEDIFRREGATSEEIIHDLLTHEGEEPSADLVRRLGDEKQAVFRDLGLPSLYPDAMDLVRRVHDATPKLGLVTGTRRENLERLVPELLEQLEACMSAGSYERGKPHPEPYARAAEALDLPPAQCVALENAIRGVQSAKAAGYGLVLAIATTMPADDLGAAGADLVVADHAALGDAAVAWLTAEDGSP